MVKKKQKNFNSTQSDIQSDNIFFNFNKEIQEFQNVQDIQKKKTNFHKI